MESAGVPEASARRWCSAVADMEVPYGDALMLPFWAGAARKELRVQRCLACGAHQFYPRPFCLACGSDSVTWVASSGKATVYSLTTIHRAVAPEWTPPYVVALVDLDEGTRLTTVIVGDAPCAIGDRVRLAWREREGLPPLPVFEKEG